MTLSVSPGDGTAFSDAPAGTPAPPRFSVSPFWCLAPAGMRRRWWLFRPFDLVARHWPLLKRRRGLLVVRMDGIGDMVLFRMTLEHFADAFGVERGDITVLGCESWATIAAEIFSGYRVITLNEHRYARNPFYRFRKSLRVRQLAPQTVVSDAYFRRALMADSLAWVTGAPEIIVSLPYINERTRAEYTYYLSQVSRIIDTGPYPTHETVRHARFLETLGVRRGPELPQLSWPERKPPIGDGGPYAVLNPGSNEFGRRWPLDNYLSLAHRVKDMGYRVVIVGKTEERHHGERIAAEADGAWIIDLTGATALPDLLDLLKHAALVVTNDTGPAHLAIGLGAPTVVIVGGGHFGSFVPYPNEVSSPHVRFVYETMACYHCFWRCHLRENPTDSFPCVAAVTTAAVVTACHDVLNSGENQKAPGTSGRPPA